MGELHKAASQGHDHTVLELLKQGVDINIKDNAGRTPLHLAAREGLDDTVECLVKQGADIFITDNHGMTPLHLAAKTARVKVIEYLVGKEVDIINIQDLDEQTALHIAASKGRDYTVKCLVKQGANIRIKDKNGRTPLDVADEIGNVEIAEFLREFLKEAGGMMTRLHLEVERGCMNTVKYLVNKGADINTKDDHGWTPLHIAAREGYDSTVEYLAEKKADINIKDDFGRTPLHIAAGEGYVYTVENLLYKGADIHIKDKQGMTTLHVAAERGRFEIVKYLVGKGAGIDTKDDAGRTPLHTAARESYRYTVECLVEEGADISIRDNLRKTPLDVAAEKGHVIIVEFLRRKMTSLPMTAESVHVEENFVSQGVDTSIQDHNEPTSLNPLHAAASQGHNYTVECLLQQKVDVNIKDNNGRTALHLAAREGRDDSVEYLVKHGANITKDKNGMTPLHLAAERARVKVVNYLADKEADIINIQDWDGQTALHIAASKNRDYTVKCLVEQGANISIRDKYGRTPMDVAVERGNVVIAEVLREAGNAMSDMTYLHLAVEGGHMNTVKYLVNKGADINIKDDHGRTPLHMAAREGYDSTVEYLAEKGANINSKDYDGWTPLHVAAVQGYEITVRTLVSKNADINIKDIREMSPLHVAAGSARYKIVEYLAGKGANISTKDSDGRTPLHTAAGAGYRYTVEYLVKKGADITIKDNKGKTPLNLAVEEGHMNVSEFLKGVEVYHRRSMEKRPGPPFTTAGSGKEKDKQIPRRNVETVSEQVQGVAQQQGQPFTSSGKEKEKQTPTKNEETVSEQVRGVAQQQGTSGTDTLPEQTKLKVKSLEADNEKLTSQLDQDKSKSSYNSILGVEVVGEKELVVTNEGINFHWKDHGFKLHIPENALCEGIPEYSINIKASLAGQFELPEGYELVSAVYWVKTTPRKFIKPVLMEVQHCANFNNPSQLHFVYTSCTQKSLPYKFEVIDEGSFTLGSKYGALSTTHFSGTGIANEVTPDEHSCQYCAQVYFTVKSLKDYWYYCHFVVTKDLEMCLAVAKRKYKQEYDIAPSIKFDGDQVALDISDDGTKTDNGWEIVPVHKAHIMKGQVDNFSSERTRVPECVLLLEWKQKDKAPEPLKYKVKMKGTGEESDFFRILYNPAVAGYNRTRLISMFVLVLLGAVMGIWFLLPSEAVDCGTLPDPANGRVSHTTGTTFGQTATYSCNPGYNLVGDRTRTCQATGVWSGSAPTCQLGCTSISKLQELEKAVAEIGAWETLCEYLGVDRATLSDLRHMINTNNAEKKRRCLQAYIDTDKACWEQVVKLVAEPPFKNARIANKIARDYLHGVGYAKHEL